MQIRNHRRHFSFWFACSIGVLITLAVIVVPAWFAFKLIHNLTYQIIFVFLIAILASNLLAKFMVNADRGFVYFNEYYSKQK